MRLFPWAPPAPARRAVVSNRRFALFVPLADASAGMFAPMQRILIIGSGGAGKSTLARRLGERTGLPVIHLDAHFWHDGWVETPKEEWGRVVAEMIQCDAWVMDGNYGGTLAARLAACDTVIFLDMPRLTCAWRIVRRRFTHSGRARAEMPAGCPERLSWEFFQWVWMYPSRRRPDILARLSGLRPDQRVVILRNNDQIDGLLATVIAPPPR